MNNICKLAFVFGMFGPKDWNWMAEKNEEATSERQDIDSDEK